jgi:hypothetical protein
VEPEGKNGRAVPGFFSLFTCTDAESLEQSRASSIFFCEGSSPRSRRISRAASSRLRKRLPDQTHGSIVRFSQPAAIPPVLIPLPCFQRGCAMS